MKKVVTRKFSNKTQKKSKTKLHSSTESIAIADVHQSHSKQLVHVYETQSSSRSHNGHKLRPSQKFTFQFAPSFQAPCPTGGNAFVVGGGGGGSAGERDELPELAYALLPTPQFDDTHYYYSIAELENLNMLDHRHPQFHRQQQQHKQLEQQQQNQLKIYQHQQLMLQLPNACKTTNMERTTTTTSPAISSTMPIYEAPQIVTLSSSSVNNTLRQQHSNTYNDNNYNKQQHSLINNIMNDAANDGNDIDNNMLLNDAGLLPIDMLLRYKMPTKAAAATTTTTTPPAVAAPNKNSNSHILTNNNSNNNINSFTSTLRASNKLLLRSHSLHPHVAYLPAAAAAAAAARRHNSLMPASPKIAVDFTDYFAEQSIIGARASVMVYDDNQKKWVPSGSSSGLSKVQIYHHQQNNTFRVVGRKLQDHEVVINCSILKGLKYNQATATFHQWRDSKFVYGLNFSSQQDAEAFARAMMHALEVLSGRVPNNAGQPTNGNGYEEDMGYRTMTSEDAAILRQQQQITGQVTPSAQTPTSQTNQNNIPQSPPTPQQGHHRTSRNSLSAPPAPQPQQMSMPPQQQQQQQQQQQPPPQQQQQQQLYAQAGSGPTQQNGIMLQQQQPQQQQPQIPQAPQAGQTQYHTPQQQMQQQQQPPTQQQQQQQPQQLQQQHHPVYSSQQLVNQNYQQPQQQNQYQQPHYVLSSSNPNLNLHQYSQQQPGAPQPPMPPPHQQNGPGGGGPIYVSAQPPPPPQGIPTSASSNSVVYASQQQMLGAGGGPPMPTQGLLSTTLQNGPPAPPLPNAAAGYGLINGPLSQSENTYGLIPAAPPNMVQSSGVGIPMPPPLNRMSSGGPAAIGAPVAPPPPPAFGGAPPPPQMFNGNAGSGAPPPPQPPAPPAPPAMGAGPGGPGAPPPPPPPPMGGMAAKKDDPAADLMGSLAAQLQMAKLKKNKSTLPPAENSGSSTSSGGSGNYGTIGRSSNGMASMMDEMAKTLARRRAQAERKEPEPEPEVKQRPWEKSNTLPHKLGSNSSNGNSNSRDNTSNSGSESPRPMRKRFGSASEETILKVNGDGLSLALSGDLDSLKAEIVREMRLEIQKVKQEIIDAIKSEFNRR